MAKVASGKAVRRTPRVLARAPDDLTRGSLRRLGEGIGRVVYASERWVVARKRSASEIIALIIVWKLLKRVARIMPGGFRERFLKRSSRVIRLLRVMMQALVAVIPKSVWFMTHIGHVWSLYRWRDMRGERLAQERLTGTAMMPERVIFPPTRVKVGGWPGWLIVSEATERVEATLDQRLAELSRAGDFGGLEQWLDRLLDLRKAGWRLGVFSVDAHLKNFGVSGDRVVLIDAGGLTDSWVEVEERLQREEAAGEPHVRLGLGPLLAERPDIAEHFDARWRAAVNREEVRRNWPGERRP